MECMTVANVSLNKGVISGSPVSNGEGFTLVEAMVSMLILMVVVLGMIQTMIYVNAINLKNDVREEAVKIGQQDIDNQTRLVRPSTALNTIILSTTTPVAIIRHFNNRDITFNLCRYVTPRGNSVEVSVSVIWQLGETNATANDPTGYSCFNGMTYTGSYNVETIISPLVG